VDSGPLPDGTTQLSVQNSGSFVRPDEDPAAATSFGTPPRPWDPAADPILLAGLDDAALELLRTRSTPHPLASITQPLGPHATSTDLPTTLIACTFPMDRIGEMMAAGHPFFAGLTDARIIALPTGHWPMLSEPKALADALGC
jgi:pimeloyl-ACP methyl ester carboxylesterase